MFKLSESLSSVHKWANKSLISVKFFFELHPYHLDLWPIGRYEWVKGVNTTDDGKSNHVRPLLSLQARDEVITVLKADKLDVALLEAKYGFITPQKVLQALQRDAIQGKADVLQEDIYEKPMEEVKPITFQENPFSKCVWAVQMWQMCSMGFPP